MSFELDITARVDGREQVTTTVSVATAAEFESLCTATVAAVERWQTERERLGAAGGRCLDGDGEASS